MSRLGTNKPPSGLVWCHPFRSLFFRLIVVYKHGSLSPRTNFTHISIHTKTLINTVMVHLCALVFTTALQHPLTISVFSFQIFRSPVPVLGTNGIQYQSIHTHTHARIHSRAQNRAPVTNR